MDVNNDLGGPKSIGSSIHVGTDYINVNTPTVVQLNEDFFVFTEDGPIHLPVKITADFQEIPKKYHEVFLNVLTSKYLNKVSFGDNPFSQCKPFVKRRWWEFWKTKYFSYLN